MSFSNNVKEAIKPFNLLNHPFYIDWSKGLLSKDCIKEYAAQYYHHVNAFPRYISLTHSKCLNISDRRVLLENLNDEEGLNGGKPHIQLWLQFSQAFGINEKEILEKEACRSIKRTITSFLKSADSSYEEGLASFYSYESQVPEIAETKIKGLLNHYNIKSKNDLEFFYVHQKADIFHRIECERLLDKIPDEKKEGALVSAIASARSLWNFLTEMHQLNLKAVS